MAEINNNTISTESEDVLEEQLIGVLVVEGVKELAGAKKGQEVVGGAVDEFGKKQATTQAELDLQKKIIERDTLTLQQNAGILQNRAEAINRDTEALNQRSEQFAKDADAERQQIAAAARQLEADFQTSIDPAALEDRAADLQRQVDAFNEKVAAEQASQKVEADRIAAQRQDFERAKGDVDLLAAQTKARVDVFNVRRLTPELAAEAAALQQAVDASNSNIEAANLKIRGLAPNPTKTAAVGLITPPPPEPLANQLPANQLPANQLPAPEVLPSTLQPQDKDLLAAVGKMEVRPGEFIEQADFNQLSAHQRSVIQDVGADRFNAAVKRLGGRGILEAIEDGEDPNDILLVFGGQEAADAQELLAETVRLNTGERVAFEQFEQLSEIDQQSLMVLGVDAFNSAVEAGRTDIEDPIEFDRLDLVYLESGEAVPVNAFLQLTPEQREALVVAGVEGFNLGIAQIQDRFRRQGGLHEALALADQFDTRPEVEEDARLAGYTNADLDAAEIFLDEHIRLDTGEWINRGFFERQEPEAQFLLMFEGVDAFNDALKREFSGGREFLPRAGVPFAGLLGSLAVRQATTQFQAAPPNPLVKLAAAGLVAGTVAGVALQQAQGEQPAIARGAAIEPVAPGKVPRLEGVKELSEEQALGTRGGFREDFPSVTALPVTTAGARPVGQVTIPGFQAPAVPTFQSEGIAQAEQDLFDSVVSLQAVTEGVETNPRIARDLDEIFGRSEALDRADAATKDFEATMIADAARRLQEAFSAEATRAAFVGGQETARAIKARLSDILRKQAILEAARASTVASLGPTTIPSTQTQLQAVPGAVVAAHHATGAAQAGAEPTAASSVAVGAVSQGLTQPNVTSQPATANVVDTQTGQGVQVQTVPAVQPTTGTAVQPQPQAQVQVQTTPAKASVIQTTPKTRLVTQTTTGGLTQTRGVTRTAGVSKAATPSVPQVRAPSVPATATGTGARAIPRVGEVDLTTTAPATGTRPPTKPPGKARTKKDIEEGETFPELVTWRQGFVWKTLDFDTGQVRTSKAKPSGARTVTGPQSAAKSYTVRTTDDDPPFLRRVQIGAFDAVADGQTVRFERRTRPRMKMRGMR